MDYNVELMIEEQLNNDIDALINKYGLGYAQKMKSILNTKIETRKFELERQKKQLEQLKQSNDTWVNINGVIAKNQLKR